MPDEPSPCIKIIGSSRLKGGTDATLPFVRSDSHVEEDAEGTELPDLAAVRI